MFENLECILTSYNNDNEIFKSLQEITVDFSIEPVYGYHKEKAEPMFDNQKCTVTSFNNDKEIFKSLMEKSNKDFFNSKSKRRILFKKIHAPFAYYDDGNDIKEQYYKRYSNADSYISYFIFSLPSTVEAIVKKLQNNKWSENFHKTLSEEDYQLLKSNLLYVGSGRPQRPFQHIIIANYLLSGQPVPGGKLLHNYLARAVLQNMFHKVLIVPFFGSNNYPACFYSEQVTIWTLKEHLLNDLNYFETFKLKHKLCVERSYPEKYLKNCFSKQAMQFVADYNVEAAIRQIGKFGIVSPIANSDNTNNWKNQISFHYQSYINSVFGLSKEKTLFYKFGLPFFDKSEIKFFVQSLNNKDKLVKKDWKQNIYVQMLPFQNFDFVFKNDDWIERVRFANEIENNLKSSLSSFPQLLDSSLKILENALTLLKSEKLKTCNLKNDFGQNTENSDKLEILLSVLLVKIHGNLVAARNEEKFLHCHQYTEQLIAKFSSSLENLFFKKLILDNPEVMHTVKEQEASFTPIFNLKIPENQNKNLLVKTNLNVNTVEEFLLQNSFLINTVNPEKCPLHDENNPKFFVLQENCIEHIKTHKHSENVKPIDRLNGQDCKKLGVYTCKYCAFKTNSKEFAEYHIRAVHENHLEKPSIKSGGTYDWKYDFERHFEEKNENEEYSKGNFKCGLCEKTGKIAYDIVQHLLGPTHKKVFLNASIGIIYNNLLTQEIGVKMMELHNLYTKNVATKAKQNKKDRTFLLPLVVNIKDTKNWFWRIPTANGEYRSETKCYQSIETSFSHIASYNNKELLNSFLENDKYSAYLKTAYLDWIKTTKDQELLKHISNNKDDRKLEPDTVKNLHNKEIKYIAKKSSFRNFVTEIKKFKLTHTKDAREDNTIIVPPD
ncbi:hypothetical protein TYRP_022328, partial [Tyrophagus putrescentiae]